MFKNKKVLVAGGTGLIGKQLVSLLVSQGADVYVTSLDDQSRCEDGIHFRKANLTEFSTCMDVCKDMNFVFNLVGVKGSPLMAKQKPASFFVTTISCNTNMMEAARKCNVDWYLYTSSIGVYSPAEVLKEDDVWETFPSKNDWFAGWAKRMGELQAQAYDIQYMWRRASIVRPANCYGPYDNFDPGTGMVIPSVIARAFKENPLKVWGDGSPVRDFIHSRDVAMGMMKVVEQQCNLPVNLGSGCEITIKKLIDIIVSNLDVKPEVIWDASQGMGDAKRLMDVSRAQSLGIFPQISLEDGIKETMDWYRKSSSFTEGHNVFRQ